MYMSEGKTTQPQIDEPEKTNKEKTNKEKNIEKIAGVIKSVKKAYENNENPLKGKNTMRDSLTDQEKQTISIYRELDNLKRNDPYIKGIPDDLSDKDPFYKIIAEYILLVLMTNKTLKFSDENVEQAMNIILEGDDDEVRKQIHEQIGNIISYTYYRGINDERYDYIHNYWNMTTSEALKIKNQNYYNENVGGYKRKHKSHSNKRRNHRKKTKKMKNKKHAKKTKKSKQSMRRKSLKKKTKKAKRSMRRK